MIRWWKASNSKIVKTYSQSIQLPLCLETGYDPSNWSKIERGVLPPPRDEDTLRAWAKALGLKRGSEDWLKFFDYAAVDSGRIPDYILKDEHLVAKLPAFFRTISGQKPSDNGIART